MLALRATKTTDDMLYLCDNQALLKAVQKWTGDQEMPSPAKSVLSSLQGVASKDRQVTGKAKRKQIDDSDDEEATAPCKAAKQGQLSPKPGLSPSKGGEHTGVENHSASERSRGAIQKESSHIESDSIPDSEDEGSGSEERAVGEQFYLPVRYNIRLQCTLCISFR